MPWCPTPSAGPAALPCTGTLCGLNHTPVILTFSNEVCFGGKKLCQSHSMRVGDGVILFQVLE